MSIVTDLTAAEDASSPIRRGLLHRRPVPYVEKPEAPDGYAPVRFAPVCVSLSGYKRRSHEFDRDGRCFWCPKVLELAYMLGRAE